MTINSMAVVKPYVNSDNQVGWFFGFALDSNVRKQLEEQGVDPAVLTGVTGSVKTHVDREFLTSLQKAGLTRKTEITFVFSGVEAREEDVKDGGKTVHRKYLDLVNLCGCKINGTEVDVEFDLDKMAENAIRAKELKAKAAAQNAASAVSIGA